MGISDSVSKVATSLVNEVLDNGVIFAIFVVILIPWLLISLSCYFMQVSRLKRLRKYIKINLGDEEAKVLKLIGGGYSRSMYASGEIKYHWVLPCGTFLFGMSFMSSSQTRLSGLEITVFNGRVTEVIADNL